MAFSKCTVDRAEAASAYEKWDRLGKQWQKRFLIDKSNPALGSWLDMNCDGNVGCKCCKFVGLTSPFGAYSVNTANALQAVNFEKHQRNEFGARDIHHHHSLGFSVWCQGLSLIHI